MRVLLLALALWGTAVLALDKRGALDVEVLDSEVHNSRRLLSLAGRRRLEYTISAFGTDFNLDLEVEQRYIDTPVPFHELDKNGNLNRVDRHLDCIYKGKVAGDDSSLAVISFCDGQLHGHIHTKEKQVSIRRPRDARELTAAYLVDPEEDTGKCGVDHKEHYTPLEVKAYRGLRANVEKKVQEARNLAESFVEILVVLDHEFFLEYQENSFIVSIILFTLVNEQYTSFPGTEEITLQMVGSIAMTEEDPWVYSASCTNNLATCKFNNEAGTPKCCVRVNGALSYQAGDTTEDSTYDGLLTVFSTWGARFDSLIVKPGTATELSFDLGHLLSGRDFYSAVTGDGVIGLAWIGTACVSVGFKYGITQATSVNQGFIANIWAHENGHNLDFDHTAGPTFPAAPSFLPCRGPGAGPFVMDPSASTGSVDWSDCSETAWGAHVSSCAGAVATTTNNIDSGGYCGNGLIDDGEECDCGLSDCSGLDPCCNGATCMLSMGTCGANDLCCDLGSCGPASGGTVCRPATSGCDDEEVCDGLSVSCPEDTYSGVMGAACTDDTFGAGQCFRGQCVSAESVCLGTTSHCAAQSDCETAWCSDSGCPVPTPTSFQRDMPNGAACPPAVAPAPTGYQCYQGVCQASSSIPEQDNCTNFVQDPGETDVDCGGPDCPGCVAGKTCVEDTDCLGSRTCDNSTSTCSDPANAPGDDLTDQLLALWDQIVQWVTENPVIAAVIGGVVALLFIGSCIVPCFRSSRGAGKPKGGVMSTPGGRVRQQ